MIKKLLLLSILSSILFSYDLTQADITRLKADLKAAQIQAKEAKEALDKAQKSLAAAKKTINHAILTLPEKDGGKVLYSTKTAFSYSDTQGNTDTQRFVLDFHGERKRGKNTIKFDLDVMTSTSDGEEDNNKWLSVLQYDRDLTKKLYFNYIGAYGEDKFSGFKYQFNTGPGIGYKPVQSDEHKLELQTNVLYSKDKFEDGTINEYASGLALVKYKWQMFSSFAFLQEAYIKSELDELDNYFLYSKTAIESKINDIFALGMSYRVDYKNVPANGKDRTDRVFLASFIISY